MSPQDCKDMAHILRTLADALDSGNRQALVDHASWSASLCSDRDPLMGQLVQGLVAVSVMMPADDPTVALRGFADTFEKGAGNG